MPLQSLWSIAAGSGPFCEMAAVLPPSASATTGSRHIVRPNARKAAVHFCFLVTLAKNEFPIHKVPVFIMSYSCIARNKMEKCDERVTKAEIYRTHTLCFPAVDSEGRTVVTVKNEITSIQTES